MTGPKLSSIAMYMESYHPCRHIMTLYPLFFSTTAEEFFRSEWCGITQTVERRRLDVRQARVRIPSRHPFRVPSILSVSSEESRVGLND
jgi:hypothetical protein